MISNEILIVRIHNCTNNVVFARADKLYLLHDRSDSRSCIPKKIYLVSIANDD